MGILYCYKCSASSDVVDSRPTEEGFVRRRRRCTQCKRRWSTLEVPKDEWRVAMELLGTIAVQMKRLKNDQS